MEATGANEQLIRVAQGSPPLGRHPRNGRPLYSFIRSHSSYPMLDFRIRFSYVIFPTWFLQAGSFFGFSVDPSQESPACPVFPLPQKAKTEERHDSRNQHPHSLEGT